MKFKSRWFEFDLPDEWWAAAGMVGFVSYRTAYRRSAVRRTMILRIDEIAVPPRAAGVPDFERDRMVSVLDAIRRATGRCRPSRSSRRSASYIATGSTMAVTGWPPPSPSVSP
jgi:hypothetical protein